MKLRLTTAICFFLTTVSMLYSQTPVTIVNPSFENGVLGRTPDGWTVLKGDMYLTTGQSTEADVDAPDHGSRYVTATWQTTSAGSSPFPADQAMSIYQDVNLSSFSSLIKAGNQFLSLTFTYYDWDPNDFATVQLDFFDGRAALISGSSVNFSSLNSPSPGSTWATETLAGRVPVGARSVRITLAGVQNATGGTARNIGFDNLSANLDVFTPPYGSPQYPGGVPSQPYPNYAPMQLVLLNDNFEKCLLNVQDLPLSSKWFGSDIQRLSMFPNQMVFDTSGGSSDLILTYITDDQPLNLAVGESLAVEFTFETRGIIDYPRADKNLSLRVGLLNSNGQRVRGRQAISKIDRLYTPYTGLSCFMAFQKNDNTFFTLFARTANSGGSNNLIDATTSYRRIGAATPTRPLIDSRKYKIEFDVKREAENMLAIVFGISGRDLTGYNITENYHFDPIREPPQFDTFVFKVDQADNRGSSLAQKITISHFRVTYLTLFRGVAG